MVSGRMIGNAREFEGLYFLEDGDNSVTLISACSKSVLLMIKSCYGTIEFVILVFII